MGTFISGMAMGAKGSRPARRLSGVDSGRFPAVAGRAQVEFEVAGRGAVEKPSGRR
ncbi:hypothetical protein HC891_11550 [Candidatus Gracilibacteria bacterium]|nr:hypothetical protein [Candidatus Gracilibacteria bacterium]